MWGVGRGDGEAEGGGEAHSHSLVVLRVDGGEGVVDVAVVGLVRTDHQDEVAEGGVLRLEGHQGEGGADGTMCQIRRSIWGLVERR